MKKSPQHIKVAAKLLLQSMVNEIKDFTSTQIDFSWIPSNILKIIKNALNAFGAFCCISCSNMILGGFLFNRSNKKSFSYYSLRAIIILLLSHSVTHPNVQVGRFYLGLGMFALFFNPFVNG